MITLSGRRKRETKFGKSLVRRGSNSMTDLMEFALSDLAVQCACAFTKFPHLKNLLGLVAVGDHYKHAVIRREQILGIEDVDWPERDEHQDNEDGDSLDGLDLYSMDDPVAWSQIAVLGQPSSDAAKEAIIGYMMKKTNLEPVSAEHE